MFRSLAALWWGYPQNYNTTVLERDIYMEYRNLPQQLFVPAIITPDGGFVYAPISCPDGTQAVPAFDSFDAAANWLGGGGEKQLWPAENRGLVPAGKIGIIDTTPDRLRDGLRKVIPSFSSRRWFVHLNPVLQGLSPVASQAEM